MNSITLVSTYCRFLSMFTSYSKQAYYKDHGGIISNIVGWKLYMFIAPGLHRTSETVLLLVVLLRCCDDVCGCWNKASDYAQHAVEYRIKQK